MLCVDGVAELEQRLELVVLGEGDNFHDCPKLTEDLSEDDGGKRGGEVPLLDTKTATLTSGDACQSLKISIYLLQNVQGHGIKHVVDDDPQHGARRRCQVKNSGVRRR